MVTHDPGCAVCADRVVYLRDGVVVDALVLGAWDDRQAQHREDDLLVWLRGQGFSSGLPHEQVAAGPRRGVRSRILCGRSGAVADASTGAGRRQVVDRWDVGGADGREPACCSRRCSPRLRPVLVDREETP